MTDVTVTEDERLRTVVSHQPYPLLFATVSGAHLYGFPSPDSDCDLRGVHLLPVAEVVGLYPVKETIEVSELQMGLHIDLVTHDIKKFFGMLLKRNGYVLEQLYSPLVVATTPEHRELKEIAQGCITRWHSKHYLGFANRQWQLFEAGESYRVKPLLYTFRVLLTGIHLMQTGKIEANLVTLCEQFRLSYLMELIEMKLGGSETSMLPDVNVDFYRRQYDRLLELLDAESQKTHLPDRPLMDSELHDFLVRTRMKS